MLKKLAEKMPMHPKPAPSTPTATDRNARSQAESEAFLQAMENAVREQINPKAIKPPVRVYNICTGDFEPGSPDKQERTAYSTKEEELNSKREYTTADFDKVVRIASSKRSIEDDWLVQIDSSFSSKTAKLRCPSFENIEPAQQRSYFKEVFRLVAVEAQDRGLRYVWMDSLCINQHDPADVAEQVPRIADYFREAEACVVVSEMVRRGLSHSVDYLGADTLNAEHEPPWKLLSAAKAPAPQPTSVPRESLKDITSYMPSIIRNALRPAISPDTGDERDEEAFTRWLRLPEGAEAAKRETQESLKAHWRSRGNRHTGLVMEDLYRNEWGLVDEIAGWVVGFHEFRMWTFQETYLSKALVHRERNLRINTVAAITIAAERLIELDDASVTAYEEGYEGSISPSRLLYLRYLYCKNLRTRFPISFQLLNTANPPEVTLMHRLKLERRTRGPVAAKSPYGITISDSSLHADEWSPDYCLKLVRQQERNALFDQDRIYSILGLFPTNVRFAMPARYDISLDAVFANLIYIRLFTGDFAALAVNEHTWRNPHSIEDMPSWIPERYGSMVYDTPKSIEGLHPPLDNYNFMTVENKKLVITAPYLEIAEAGYETCNCFAAWHSLGDFWLLPAAPQSWYESGTLRPQFSFRKQNIREPRTRIRNEYHLATLKAVLPDAAKERRAVMVNIGTGRSVNEPGHHLAWLILLSDDGRKTWRKVADLRTDDILEDKPAREWVETFTVF